MTKLLLLVWLFPVVTYAQKGDFQALIVSADDSYMTGEKSLEFASMDASRLERALVSAGKVPDSNVINLKNPSMETFDDTINRLAKKSAQKFMFYFSGHSDENGLHLKDGAITKKKFHNLLAKVDAKVKIVVFDSCFSGALKSKGAMKSKPIELVQYNVDEPTGSVILTSSSGTELSYESDKLKGSIFTYHLVSGLYGQADTNADGLVTIDELYQYVYSQTKFQSMVSGGKVQSPEFESKLTGQGALVVSYPARINGQVFLSANMQGEVSLTASKGLNFFKFYKNKGEDRALSVPRGQYEVTVVEEKRVGSGSLSVAETKSAHLDAGSLSWRERDIAEERSKGGTIEEQLERPLEKKFIFGLGFHGHPAFHANETDAAMLELHALTPSAKWLWTRWRLGVFIGGEAHEVKGGGKNEYDRMSVGVEGNWNGFNFWNMEWVAGLRFGSFNNKSTTPGRSTTASLSHLNFGARFQPNKWPVNFAFLIGSDTIKYADTGEQQNVSTVGVTVGF